LALDAKWEKDNEQCLLVDSALIALLCGTVFRKDYFDPTKGRISNVTKKPIGDSSVDIYSPFEVIPDLQNNMFISEASVRSLSWIKRAYGKEGDGYTGLADKVTEIDDLNTALSYRERLRLSTGMSSGGTSFDNRVSSGSVVVECYIAPTEKHKNGLYICEAGGIPLYVGESPYYNPNIDDSWHPYTEFVWGRSPLRRHGISLIENLIPLQKRLNGIDSLVILNRMTMVTPQWMIPKGCRVGYISGRPGLNIEYRPVGAGGAGPQKMPGVGLPGDVFQERQNVVQEMHQIALDNEVLGGNQPSGVNTAAALNMLLEQTFSKFSPFIQRWEKFIEGGQQKKLIIMQKEYKEPRPELRQVLKSLSKDISDIELNDFMMTDLQDNVNVRIEAGSSLPRSAIVHQQQLLELQARGLLGQLDPQTNPVGNQEFLENFGVDGVDYVTNPDVEQAKHVISILNQIVRAETEQEAEALVNENWPELKEYDDLEIHQMVIETQMKKPGFKDRMDIFLEKVPVLDDMGQPTIDPMTGEVVIEEVPRGVFELKRIEILEALKAKSNMEAVQAPIAGGEGFFPQQVADQAAIGTQGGPPMSPQGGQPTMPGAVPPPGLI
jgi:hypothetical protein